MRRLQLPWTPAFTGPMSDAQASGPPAALLTFRHAAAKDSADCLSGSWLRFGSNAQNSGETFVVHGDHLAQKFGM